MNGCGETGEHVSLAMATCPSLRIAHVFLDVRLTAPLALSSTPAKGRDKHGVLSGHTHHLCVCVFCLFVFVCQHAVQEKRYAMYPFVTQTLKCRQFHHQICNLWHETHYAVLFLFLHHNNAQDLHSVGMAVFKLVSLYWAWSRRTRDAEAAPDIKINTSECA